MEALERLENREASDNTDFRAQKSLQKILGKHQLIDLGWVDDPQLVSDAHGAADIFSDALGSRSIRSYGGGSNGLWKAGNRF